MNLYHLDIDINKLESCLQQKKEARWVKISQNLGYFFPCLCLINNLLLYRHLLCLLVILALSGMVLSIHEEDRSSDSANSSENRSGKKGGKKGGSSNGGKSNGGNSGGNRNCRIVAAGSTTCVGAATVTSCFDSTYLMVSCVSRWSYMDSVMSKKYLFSIIIATKI